MGNVAPFRFIYWTRIGRIVVRIMQIVISGIASCPGSQQQSLPSHTPRPSPRSLAQIFAEWAWLMTMAPFPFISVYQKFGDQTIFPTRPVEGEAAMWAWLWAAADDA